jgi:hypothetical protein
MVDLAIWNNWEDALIALAALCALYLAVIWATAVTWTYRDISERTTDPMERAAAVIVVAVFGIPGLLLHVLMRPRTTIEDQIDRRLEAEAMFQDIQERPACPSCAARVDPDFIMCPLCRAELRKPCVRCGQALAMDWVMCPFCRSERAPAPSRPARGASAPTPSLEVAASRISSPKLAAGRSR